jgi:MFS-type transporter involved in bile tolerance (Atg22 family)
MAMIVVMSIIYSMIHSSIISVGRNPMSQAAVYRNVIQLSTLVIIILAVAVGVIYMVLTKI